VRGGRDEVLGEHQRAGPLERRVKVEERDSLSIQSSIAADRAKDRP
jgi:hypothetical protein